MQVIRTFTRTGLYGVEAKPPVANDVLDELTLGHARSRFQSASAANWMLNMTPFLIEGNAEMYAYTRDGVTIKTTTDVWNADPPTIGYIILGTVVGWQPDFFFRRTHNWK